MKFTNVYTRVTATNIECSPARGATKGAAISTVIERGARGARVAKSAPPGMPHSPGRCLELETSTRTVVLQLATGEERDAWFGVLQQPRSSSDSQTTFTQLLAFLKEKCKKTYTLAALQGLQQL